MGDPLLDYTEDVEVIDLYTREDAIEDGILKPVYCLDGRRKREAYFTAQLYHTFSDSDRRHGLGAIMGLGLAALRRPNPQDLPGVRKLREIIIDRIWVVEEPNGVLTFMRPEDY